MKDFAAKIASFGDAYVNDAFGTSHRAHASTVGVAKHFDKPVSGLLLEKELVYLKDKLEDPVRPYTRYSWWCKDLRKDRHNSSLNG